MKPKVIIYKKVESTILEYVKEACDVFYFEHLDADNMASFYEALKDAKGLFGTGLKVDAALLEKAPNLKIVSNVSVGYDNLDVPALTHRGVMATNTPDVLNETVADTMIGLMLATARRIPELDHMVKAGKWTAHMTPAQFGVDVHHKTLGIIGMGRIGAAIAKRAHFGFGMNILYHNRSRNVEVENTYHATYCSLDELCQEADFICLMVPLSPQTTKLIGEREFRLMKKTAIFVNGSRGTTVDEEALVLALQEGEILAAGLDVFVQEPVDPQHPLLSMPNVVTLPHIGSATLETRQAMARFAAENFVTGIQGNRPPALVNPEVI
ncbi:bifunctional glyoxylate/hydroxypyruvate reductase B [Brevibacillus choshinensis]|uniref:Bifunctional glyoxylate/hydroxypyruvate reductase B n=1 Tax=Brevibacillus choshinensis TaxID=54911 RepID=A0ABR5ND42_BRECH|nr:D-glycerate dehydrogenase [Brevibacillus choshinensis]KQL49488.1 bifunctional glyoxylate/hydroxypyruvate reductase B [Brevibacillus choshinensis]